MTPKEKAKELLEKYADTLPSVFYNVVESKNYHSAKICAIIAVDELIKLSSCFEITDNYYEKVKKEIEKL